MEVCENHKSSNDFNLKNEEYYKLLGEYLNPLLNDYYQFTMAYAYFVDYKHEDIASFDVFYRKNPFNAKVSNSIF